jgi:UDP-N-acetylglucosamine acyltransferase
MTAKIHPTSIVYENVEIGEDVQIGPYCVVYPYSKIGDGCKLLNNVTIMSHSIIGKANIFYPYVVIGGDPQDLTFKGGDTRVIIGNNNVFREGVTVNRGSHKEQGLTIIGNNNYLMAQSHVAHDCVLEDDIIIANCVAMGGHTKIEQGAYISGEVGIHQFVTIGKRAFIGGCSRISHDAPPFMITVGNPSVVKGVNVIGLRRLGFSTKVIDALRNAYRLIWRSKKPTDEALALLEKENGNIKEVMILVNFLKNMAKGRMGRAREANKKW